MAAVAVCLTIGAQHSRGEEPAPAAAQKYAPQYTDSGALKFPDGFREWIFVGTALGLTYGEHPSHPDEQKFTNVYLTPPAYAEFRRSGTFPEKTMLALAVYRQAKKQPQEGLPLGGSYADELVAVELAVKDAAQSRDGWSYFDFSPQSGDVKPPASAKPFATDKCFDCHAQHGAVDNVFVQFYPVLKRLQPPAR